MLVINLHWNPKEVCSNTCEGIPQQQIDTLAIESEDRRAKCKVSFCLFIRRRQPRTRVALPVSIIWSGKIPHESAQQLVFWLIPSVVRLMTKISRPQRWHWSFETQNYAEIRHRSFQQEHHESKRETEAQLSTVRQEWRVQRMCSAGTGSTCRSQPWLGLCGLHTVGSTSSDSTYSEHGQNVSLSFLK